MKNILSALLLLIAVHCKAQTTLYVDGSVAASGAGTSWSTAYKTLNEALNTANATSASVKHTINIATGTYYPTGIQAGTNRDSSFVIIRSRIKLYGGFPAGGGVRNVVANPTILSGNIGSATSTFDNSYHVFVMAGITAATADSILLDGLKVTDGSASGNNSIMINGQSIYEGYGGNMTNKVVGGGFYINNCTFTNGYATYGGAITQEGVVATYITAAVFSGNTASGVGGAIYQNNALGNPLLSISNTTFSSNNGLSGGAVWNLRYGTPASVYDNCTFTGNAATGTQSSSNGFGGALYTGCGSGPADVITNCTFTGNTGVFGGAACLANGSSATAGPNFLNNCTFTGNTASYIGGGLYNSADNLTYTINHCTFTGNKAGNSGGGIYNKTVTNGTGTITNSTFTADSAGLGGGVFNTGRTSITHCRFTLNKANNGGGLYNTSPVNGVIANDTISGNMAAVSGGGLYNYNVTTSYSLSNTLFSGNKALLSGGALYDSAASPGIVNCTFAGDTALNGSALYNTAASSPAITSSIIWEGNPAGILNNGASAPAITYSTVRGGYTGTGNSSADPLFLAPVAPAAAPTTAGDYRVVSCSPAVEAGLNAGPYTGISDLAGNPRLYGLAVDQGAYENQNIYINAISGTTNVCVGATTSLSNATPGGTWMSGNTSVATISAAGLVAGLTSGTAVITYTVAGNNGCSTSATTTVNVFALPIVLSITGNDTLCVSGTGQLATLNSFGSWGSLNQTVATVNGSGLVTAHAVGTAVITFSVTNASGCTDSALKTIRVVSAFHSQASAEICSKAFYNFGQQVLSGAGTYNQTFTSSGGCDSFVTLVLTVKPAINTAVSQAGSQLTASLTGAAYQWIDCSNHLPISGATGQAFTATANGAYAVIITSNGCSDTSACRTVSGLGLDNPAEMSAISLYPNPATDLLQVGINPQLLDSKYQVINMVGKVVQEGTLFQVKTSVSVIHLPPGQYLLKLVKNGVVYRSPVITINK